MYNSLGAEVTLCYCTVEERMRINANSWTTGIYIVQVEAQDGVRTLRAVKE